MATCNKTTNLKNNKYDKQIIPGINCFEFDLYLYPIDMEQWKKNLQSYADISNNERNQNSQLMISQNRLNKEKIDYFNERAVPY